MEEIAETGWRQGNERNTPITDSTSESENKRSSTTTLLGGRGGARLTAGRGVSGTSASAVVVRATVVIGVIVRSIGVRVVVATSSGGVSPSRGVVVVSLAIRIVLTFDIKSKDLSAGEVQNANARSNKTQRSLSASQ
eukprot:scaffold45099_cov204-Skeletonema_marinoi.AAC.2